MRLLSLSGRVSNENTWKMNAALLHDIQSQEEIKTEIQRTIQAHNTQLDKTWDKLKEEWRENLETAERNRCMRITKTLNEILRRIRIIERGGELTFTTQEYIDIMKINMTKPYENPPKQVKLQLSLNFPKMSVQTHYMLTTLHPGSQNKPE